MSFYNPYSKYPDMGGGMQDMASMLMQWYMMKNMFPGKGKTTEETAITQQPAPRGQADPLTGMRQNVVGQAPGEMGQSGENDHIQQLIQYMKKIGVI